MPQLEIVRQFWFVLLAPRSPLPGAEEAAFTKSHCLKCYVRSPPSPAPSSTLDHGAEGWSAGRRINWRQAGRRQRLLGTDGSGSGNSPGSLADVVHARSEVGKTLLFTSFAHNLHGCRRSATRDPGVNIPGQSFFAHFVESLRRAPAFLNLLRRLEVALFRCAGFLHWATAWPLPGGLVGGSPHQVRWNNSVD